MRELLKAGYGALRNAALAIENKFDYQMLDPDVTAPEIVTHRKWPKQLAHRFNKPGKRVLEIGSREVTGPGRVRPVFTEASYTGFDFYEGPNVDVVGDAHKLASYFDTDTKFDLIVSLACFEHFAMPWVVAEQIARLLPVGGHVFVETHFSFSSHERPWNFFQFSDMALRALFCPALGFECLDAGMSNPIVGRYSSLADKYLRNKRVGGLYCHSGFFGKKVRDVPDFDWSQVDLAEVVGDTAYPEPE